MFLDIFLMSVKQNSLRKLITARNYFLKIPQSAIHKEVIFFPHSAYCYGHNFLREFFRGFLQNKCVRMQKNFYF